MVDVALRRDAVENLLPLRDVIAEHNLSAQKSLGQNFLLDMNITDKIVREACTRDSGSWAGFHAVEVGPGPGGLTRALLKSDVERLTAIEYDARAVTALRSLQDASDNSLDIVQGDALKMDITTLCDKPRVIVANLPYNIATPLLINWLRQIHDDCDAYSSMALMFQKEVADRIVALPETKAYGRLSVLSQWLCDVGILYDLPPTAFVPAPKVRSSVVFFKPRKRHDAIQNFDAVGRVTAAAFQQRRKMIRSSLKGYADAMKAVGIDTTLRAESLSVEDFIQLASFDNKSIL